MIHHKGKLFTQLKKKKFNWGIDVKDNHAHSNQQPNRNWDVGLKGNHTALLSNEMQFCTNHFRKFNDFVNERPQQARHVGRCDKVDHNLWCASLDISETVYKSNYRKWKFFSMARRKL